MEISGGIDICQMSFPTGATAILLLVCILSLLSTKCPAASILRSARFSSMQTTKKPHGYHKIAVWQKDDRIRKSPLKFYAQYYSILSGDFQALIITELWWHIYCFICYFSISSANWNWDFMYSKEFNNCYILLSNISQALENTKFIAGELSLIVSLVLYCPTSVYELW